MSLTAEQISQNWELILIIIQSNFKEERQEQLLKLFAHFKDRMCLAPASGKLFYHNCFTGGYIHHVLNVIKLARLQSKLWSELNPDFKDYTDEELIFVALSHDLGKIGDLTEDYYIPTDQDWKVKRGEMYEHNPHIQFMKVADRSIFILQHFGITLNEKEYLGIKLHDGLYEDSNRSYLISFNESYQLKTSLPYIIHTADMMACQSENITYKLSATTILKVPTKLLKPRKPKNFTKKKLEAIGSTNEEAVEKITATFDELFGGKI